ncbi:MAG: O-antigen ligase family protein [Terriglobales bacterium]
MSATVPQPHGVFLPAPLAAPAEMQLQRLAFWTAVGCALLAVVLIGAASTAAWVLVDCLLWLGLVILVLGATRDGVRLPWHPILWPALAYGGLVCWQWLSRWSVYPAATLTGLLQLAGCGAMLYLALFAFRRPSNLRRLGTVLWWFTGALGAEALFQFFTSRTEIYGFRSAAYATPVGPYIYHNHFAGCMDLLLPVALVVAFQPRRRSRDILWMAWLRRGILPALGLAAVIVSQSRGGVFALLVEGAAAAAVFWRTFARHRRRRRTVAIAAAAIIGFTVLAGWGPLLKRLGHLDQHDISALARLHVAESCLTIWRAHPWLGTGFETFPVVYPQYQTFSNGQRFLEAHNEYAQTLAETGIGGALCVLAFAVLLAYFALGRPAADLSRRVIYLRKALLIACAGFLFHSFGDFQFHSPANALLFFLIAGAAAAYTWGTVARGASVRGAVDAKASVGAPD